MSTTTPNAAALYPQRDSETLGEFYLRHVSAMTAEGLHSKSDIAAQLAWRDARIAELEAALAQQVPEIGPWPKMHPETLSLVRRFSWALADKLAAAEEKYGYSDGWMSPEWMDECRQHLLEHVAKGDPRDVAAYCAFLWHHGEKTAAPVAQQVPAVPEGWRDTMARMVMGIDHLAEIARLWEPDYSTGADRRGWVLAKDARDDAMRLLAAAPMPTPEKP